MKNHIFLFGGEKGGTGKTTMAINFAGWLSLQGIDFLFVDADKQESSSKWVSRRNENPDLPDINCVQLRGKDTVKQIRELNKRYPVIVIDAGGRDSVELRSSMAICNSFYLPLKASQHDADTLPSMSELIEKAAAFNPDLQVNVIINMASPNPVVKESNDLIELISQIDNIGVVETIIFNRKVYEDIAKTGHCVLEYQPKNYKAINELKLLYEEIADEFDEGKI